MQSAKKNKGFTLIELMIVVALIGVLSAMAMVGSTGFIANHRLRSLAVGLYQAFSFAHSEAIRSGSSVWVDMGTADAILVYRVKDRILFRFPQDKQEMLNKNLSIRPKQGTYDSLSRFKFGADGLLVNDKNVWVAAQICLNDVEASHRKALYTTIAGAGRIVAGLEADTMCKE